DGRHGDARAGAALASLRELAVPLRRELLQLPRAAQLQGQVPPGVGAALSCRAAGRSDVAVTGGRHRVDRRRTTRRVLEMNRWWLLGLLWLPGACGGGKAGPGRVQT